MSVQAQEELIGEGMLTVKDAVAFSRLSRSELYARMDRGELAYAKLGRRRMIPRKGLVEMLAKGLVGGERSSPPIASASRRGKATREAGKVGG